MSITRVPRPVIYASVLSAVPSTHAEHDQLLWPCPAFLGCAMGKGTGGARELQGSPSLTEHPFQPDEAADEAVKVDVHVFVCVAHSDDVIELAVEVEALEGEEENEVHRLAVSFPCPLARLARDMNTDRVLGVFLPPRPAFPSSRVVTLSPLSTCFIDSISHFIAIDGAGMVCVIVFEDFLKTQSLKTPITHLIPN